jgi:serine/threonine protein kinase HipA of HipAB toxin-antitoxin module
MYDPYIMRRTQIYLDESQSRLLEAQSKASGFSISHLIRAAVDTVYGKRRSLTQAQKLRIAESTAGAWASRTETGADYVDRVRGRGRLDRLTTPQ